MWRPACPPLHLAVIHRSASSQSDQSTAACSELLTERKGPLGQKEGLFIVFLDLNFYLFLRKLNTFAQGQPGKKLNNSYRQQAAMANIDTKYQHKKSKKRKVNTAYTMKL